jgi:two-component system chemotaxis response regulator CheB
VKIFIADDSISYRSQIEKQLALYPQIEVVGSSRIGPSTASMVVHARPDLLILDLSEGDSMAFRMLEELHAEHALAISVLGLIPTSDLRMKAISLGCKDLVEKHQASGERDGPDSVRVAKLVVDHALRLAGGIKVPRHEMPKRPRSSLERFEPSVVVIASSTGGPPVLERMFEVLHEGLRIPILITQHMPESFTRDLAARLASVSHNPVREAIDGEELKAGQAYLAPGNFHMRLVNDGRKIKIALDQGEKLHSVRPAADYLFKTAAEIFGANCMGFVLTGMGADAAEGARSIKELGGKVMIQDKDSAAVWGMPGAVHAMGAFDSMGDIDAIAGTFAKMVMRKVQ